MTAPNSTTPPTTPAWDENLLKNPHEVADKRKRVQQMFSAIAPTYDLNNRLHSFGRDQAWRRKAVKLAKVKPTDVVVDVACGTGDLTLLFAAAKPRAAMGIDFTFEMLPIARSKSAIGNRQSAIRYLNGDAQSLPSPMSAATSSPLPSASATCRIRCRPCANSAACCGPAAA